MSETIANATIVPTQSSEDILILAYIHIKALEDDETARIKFESKQNFQEVIEEMLKRQMRVDTTSDSPVEKSEEEWD